jgi:GNAT superfamily N-acetyltransferase
MELVELRRGDHDRYTWTPFEPSADFTSGWWDHAPYEDDDPWFLQALDAGIEVARVELDDTFGVYEGGPTFGPGLLEIQLIEVATGFRRRGIGTWVVRELATRHPDRTLVALSEAADEFWASLGWRRYQHPTEPQYHRPLFVHP